MNSDKIRNWAHFAEIVSGIAVVFTLVFVVLEIRGNSDLVRANAFDRSMESLIQLRTNIASNDASLRVMADHWGIESPEVLRQQLLVVSIWSIYEKTYYSHQYGLVGVAEWERFEKRICGYSQTRMDFWKESVSVFLTAEFRNFVIDSCQQSS